MRGVSSPDSRHVTHETLFLMQERSSGLSRFSSYLPLQLLSLSLLALLVVSWGGGGGEACSLPMTDGSTASGGGISEKGRFSYGFASSPGERTSMDDFYDTRVDDIDGEIVGLFGVFDGHGGPRAAEYLKNHLLSNIIDHPQLMKEPVISIALSFRRTDSEFLKADSGHSKDSGSTATIAFVSYGRLVVAYNGDSRAVIFKGGEARQLSLDLTPNRADERQRIEEAGGFVTWAGVWRVNGVLSVTRAFGDNLLKQYVVCDPEIKEELVDGSVEFLILATNGLWDVVTNEEAVSMVKPIEDPEQAAKRLVQEASLRESADNITVVIVRFLDGTMTTKGGTD